VAEPGARGHRHRRGAAHPRCRPLRPAKDQEAHPRIPRGAQAQPDGHSILCFVGPPGVGDSALGQSIARATGRDSPGSASAALGEAEIRGHRRTYWARCPATSSGDPQRPAPATGC
jgi:hypothetical protein